MSFADVQGAPRFVVAQLGARMHYGVPRALAERGMLEVLYTDAVAPDLLRRTSMARSAALPAIVRRLLSRDPGQVPTTRIHTDLLLGIRYALRLRRSRSTDERIREYLWAADRFSAFVLKRGFANASGVYGFNTAALRTFEAAREQGLLTVLEQTIAPYEVEFSLLNAERAKFPDWERPQRLTPAELTYIERERAEWEIADRIVCGSSFVVDGIRKLHGPAGKCAVVPYGVDSAFSGVDRGRRRPGPLRVLTVGAVGLRKGTPYVLDAARALSGVAQFRFVGPILADERVLPKDLPHVEFKGSVPRSEMRAQFAWADVFLLPSVCEGSATAVYEALSSGLPCICTPNTGSVVQDGVSGFIMPLGDAERIVEHLTLLASRSESLIEMSREAAARSAQYSYQVYGEATSALLRRAVACHSRVVREKLPRFVVAQLGARRHYAVPRILSHSFALERMYTDGILSDRLRPAVSLLSWFGAESAGRAKDRLARSVPAEKITSFNAFGLAYARRRKKARTLQERIRTYMWAADEFANLVLKAGFGRAEGVYTFNTAGLKLLDAARSRGLTAVVEQTIAPYEIEFDLLQRERIRFPEWEPPVDMSAVEREYAARERAEWNLADRIIVGSSFVLDAIRSAGGPFKQCFVVPYGFDAQDVKLKARPVSRPIRVLTVGAIGLRKGSPYVIEAARRLGAAAHFRMVGPIDVPAHIMSDIANHVELVGVVPRSEVRKYYEWADVYLLPSVCEGSAMSTYEALAFGLPVVCTPNTGSVVEDNVTGRIIPVGEADAIVDAIREIAAWDRESHNGGLASVGLETYEARLRQALVFPTA